MTIHIGIDIGSVAVKAALFSRHVEDVTVLSDACAGPLALTCRELRHAEGGRCWLAWTRPIRLAGNPLAQARRVLDQLMDVAGRSLGQVSATGTGAALFNSSLGVEHQAEFRALGRAVELVCPDILTLFEMGGHTSKYIRFERHATGRIGIADYQTNADCAAGTGSFLDQQAARLKFEVEEIGDAVARASRTAQITGRCSVFAKSDMIHAQQRGFTPEEVLSGLCEGVVRNFKGLTKGKALAPPAALVGGVAGNGAVVRALERTFGWAPGVLVVPPEHASFTAIGAALLAAEPRTACASSIRNVSWAASEDRATPMADVPVHPGLTLDNVILLRDRLAARGRPDPARPARCFLGIDIGSVSTNLVVIDEDGDVLTEVYLRTDARPIDAVTRGLRQIGDSLGDAVLIRGVGTTGSGRELIGSLVRADTVNDEVTAHKMGADFVDRSVLGLGIDTIFEIGGQDAKFIRIQDGVVVDFTMNQACAAGTGSFLEERAREMGIAIETDFARLAFSSRHPLRLGERCTVFMERDVQSWIQRGCSVEDIIAGLAYSVAVNYVNRVIRGRPIGNVIFFQGGTAYNDAVAAALSAVVGKRIIVPPFNGVMGALGAALLARQKMQAADRATGFRGFDLETVSYETLEFTCRQCTNYCQVQRFTVGDEQTHWGDKCSDRYRKPSHSERQPIIEDLPELRRRELLARHDPDAGDGPIVGVPLCLSTYDWAPFWLPLLKALGLRSRLSDPTTNATVQLGLDGVVSEPCFPIQVAHGHVRSLMRQHVDLLLVPNNITGPDGTVNRPSYFCPWNQTLPLVLRAAPFMNECKDRVLAPTIWFDQPVGVVAAEIRRALKAVGIRRRESDVLRAANVGLASLHAFQDTLVAAGRRALDTLEQHKGQGVLLLGRAYNLYDKGVNLDLAGKLRRYYGANVLGSDFLDLAGQDVDALHDNMFWTSGRKILAAAAYVRDKPWIHIVYLTNFKCGPDSYIRHFLAEIAGRPYLTLQIDGHHNDAGLLTRCEAYLHSKGVA